MDGWRKQAMKEGSRGNKKKQGSKEARRQESNEGSKEAKKKYKEREKRDGPYLCTLVSFRSTFH